MLCGVPQLVSDAHLGLWYQYKRLWDVEDSSRLMLPAEIVSQLVCDPWDMRPRGRPAGAIAAYQVDRSGSRAEAVNE